MESYILKKIRNLSIPIYLFWTTLSFYLFLLIVNPPNKIIALSFILLFLIYQFKIKSLEQSLFFTYVSSLIILTGKTYPIQLLPAGIFPIEIWPNGYFTNLTISANHIIAFFMLMIMARTVIIKKVRSKFKLTDILLVVFFILKILSATLASKNPALSLPFEILGLTGLIAYFYARIFIKADDVFWKNLVYILSSLVVFESVLGLTQLAAKSPLYKNIEFQIGIEYYGHAVDETSFTFRPVGTFDHANILGIWVASVCVFIFNYCLKGKSNVLWFSFFTGCVLLITTISRGAWLGFVMGFVFIVYAGFNHKNFFKPLADIILKWRGIIVPTLLILVLFFVIPRAQNSLNSFQIDAGGGYFRKILILDTLEIVKLHPLLGTGASMSVFEGISLNLNTIAASIPLVVHNWFLFQSVENGLFTVFVFIFFLTLSSKRISENIDSSVISISTISTIICLIFASIFQPYINISLILLLLSLTNGDMIRPENAK